MDIDTVLIKLLCHRVYSFHYIYYIKWKGTSGTHVITVITFGKTTYGVQSLGYEHFISKLVICPSITRHCINELASLIAILFRINL